MSDLIDRQAVIELVKNSYYNLAESIEDTWAMVADVEALPSAEPKRGKWIPVTERMPEDDTEVFVYLFDRDSPYIAWVCDSKWYTEEFEVDQEYEPHAWMPLPSPWKGERNE